MAALRVRIVFIRGFSPKEARSIDTAKEVG